MGRKRIKMEAVSKEKLNSTYKNKKAGLVKKIRELTILCDIKACMIILPPQLQTSSGSPDQPRPPPVIWPEESPDQVANLINLYRASTDDGSTSATRGSGFTLTNFYHNRIKKKQEELEKARKRRREMVYPTSTDAMSHLSESELRDIANKMDIKIANVRCMIESMKVYSSNAMVQQNQYYQQQHNHDLQPRSQTFSFMEQLMGKNEDGGGILSNQYASFKNEFVHAPPPPPPLGGGPYYHVGYNGQFLQPQTLQMGFMQFPNHVVEQNLHATRGMEFFQ